MKAHLECAFLNCSTVTSVASLVEISEKGSAESKETCLSDSTEGNVSRSGLFLERGRGIDFRTFFNEPEAASRSWALLKHGVSSS